jgi:glycosyltransferase involved in cell wall biosynthesis
MQAYVREHLGVEARVVHPPVYGEPPFARFGSFEAGDVLLINPCAVKGIGIFLELARMFPEQRFAALKGWGTTGADLRALAAEPNITALDTVGAIEEAFARTKILLVPSLWYEGFGLVAMEAMLRGIPVIASDSGGLAEAKQGTRFIVPVRPITRYGREFDENHMPVPLDGKLERWEMDAWGKSLHVLLTKRDVYEEESELSRRVALDFVSRLRASQFEELLTGLRR